MEIQEEEKSTNAMNAAYSHSHSHQLSAVQSDIDVVQYSSGSRISDAVCIYIYICTTADGDVYSWGCNEDGRIGSHRPQQQQLQ